MEAQALLRINAREASFLPVELKVRMLMEQAGMRMRASAMVGKRISQLDDVIRVRALILIVMRGIKSPSADEEAAAAAAESASEVSGKDELERQKDGTPHVGLSVRFLPSTEEIEIFSRMAVSAVKTVLFQIAEEAEAETAKDVIDVYEGVITTEDLSLAAAEGFPTLNVDNLLSTKHLRYRKLVAARHRYLIRKLGVLLDMKEGLELLLDLASDEDNEEESLADVDLGSPKDAKSEEDTATKLSLTEESNEDGLPRRNSDIVKASVSTPRLLSTPSAKKAMFALQNTTWDKESGNEDTTEDETDADTPPQETRRAVVSPSR